MGAGTGMSCLGFKGGIGTSSRVTPGRPHRRGAADDQLRRARPAHRGRRPRRPAPARRRPAREKPAGSCIGVVVTDAPVDPRRLRAAGPPGRARPGAHRVDRPPRQRRDLPGRQHHRRASTATAPSSTTGGGSAAAGLDDLFEAVVDAAEESVLNSLLMSPTTVGRDGNTSEGLDPDTVVRAAARARPPGRDRLGARPSGSRWRTASSWPRRSSCPDADRAAAVPARGAAVPQGRPHLVVRRGLPQPPRRALVRRVPGRPARHRLVGRRRHRRVPARRADRPRAR